MPRTPNPTAAAVLDIYLPLVGDNLDEALEEIRLRLEENLPGVIDLKNNRRGWFGIKAKEIPKPAKYHIAPAQLVDEHCNTILVGVSAETNAQGIGGAFKNEVEVVIYSVDKKAIAPLQILNHWRRAALIRGVMRVFLDGCVNSENRNCWRSFLPTGYSMLPAEWSNQFTGIACTFRMIIPPPTP